MNGFDYSEFSSLINQLEDLGADMDVIAERVLDAGSEPARRAFQRHMPKSKLDKEHARDNVVVSETRKGRYGSRYIVIGAVGGISGKRVTLKRTKKYKGKIRHYTDTNADQFSYLYLVENGHVRAPAHPFTERGYRAAQAAASGPMKKALLQELDKKSLADEIKVVETGCNGFCALGPIMVVYPEGIIYVSIKATDIPDLVEEHLVKGRVLERLLYREPVTDKPIPTMQEIPFFAFQELRVLKNRGLIDPEKMEEY
ncbi:MAG: (2Fe-2S) ferredoxin domain-containing protein, partial [Clostridiales bacterium]|nr:(2Fe-2S) ferredoxin domain-containing protein [Clostridiales bacterium]